MNNTPRIPEPPLARTNTFARVALLFLGMFTAVLVIGMISMAYVEQTRVTLLTTSALQNVLAFALPSLFMAYLCDRDPFKVMGVSYSSTPLAYVFAVLVLFSAAPWLNQTIHWNEQLQLPAWLSPLTEMEENARAVTVTILKTDNFGGFLVNVLTIGVLTGICEELFFRAGVQRMLARTMNVHAAVWIAAAIFSLCHFQVYGFMPRMLLGALLGYFYIYSRSVWVPAAIHAINNSSVVVAVWQEGSVQNAVDDFGVTTYGFPWTALGCLVITLLLFYKKDLFMPWLKRKR